MAVHIALDTSKLDESITFYKAFLGAEPAKVRDDYAKFELGEPALNLTLNVNPKATNAGINHLGIQVEDTAMVDAAAERLKASGLVTLTEKDTDCCYALQDKVWVADPNGVRWEVFTVKQADTTPVEPRTDPPQLQATRGCC